MHRLLLLLKAAGFCVLAIGLYAWLVRPWHAHWGATSVEIAKPSPGVDLLAYPQPNPVIHAVTIQAPSSAIWPWLVQLGQDRGGFYSYAWLENIFGCEMTNATRIHPEWQNLQAGDSVWFTPSRKFGGNARMTVSLLEKERVLVLVTPPDFVRIRAGGKAQDWLWSLSVEPIDERTSRLICRGASGNPPSAALRLASFLVWEPAHFIMERKMMLTIKQLAESNLPSAAQL